MGGDQRESLYPGQIEAGNIDLSKRPVIKNDDGTVSTERSFSIGTDKGEVLIPQIVGGKTLSKDAAIEHFHKTGEHLGIFQDVKSANAAADIIHNRGQQSVIIPDVGAARYWYVDPNATGVPAPQDALYRMNPNKFSPPHEDQQIIEVLQKMLLPEGTKPSF